MVTTLLFSDGTARGQEFSFTRGEGKAPGELVRWTAPGCFARLAVSENGEQVVSASWYTSDPLHVWDLKTGREIPVNFEYPEGRVMHLNTVRLLPGETTIIAGGTEYEWAEPVDAAVVQKLLEEDERRRPMLRVWDIRTGRIVRELDGNSTEIMSIHLSPDGQLVTSGRDGDVVSWDVNSWKAVRRATIETRDVYKIGLLANPRQWVGTKTATGWFIFDSTTGRMVRNEANNRITGALAVHPDGQKVAIGRLGAIEIHDTTDESAVRSVDIPGGSFIGNGANTLCWSADGSLLIAGIGSEYIPGSKASSFRGTDFGVVIYDGKSLQQLHLIKDHRNAVLDVQMHPDGRSVIAASADGTLSVWQLPESVLERVKAGDRLTTKAPIEDVQFLSAGEPAAARQVLRWDLKQGAVYSVLVQETRDQSMTIQARMGELKMKELSEAETQFFWEVKTVVDDLCLIDCTVGHVKFAVTKDDVKTQYDTASQEPMTEAQKALRSTFPPRIGTRLTLSLRPDGAIASIEHPRDVEWMASGLVFDALMMSLPIFPSQPVAATATWQNRLGRYVYEG